MIIFNPFFRYRINGAKIFKDQLTIRNLHVDYINNVPVRNLQHLTGDNIKIIGNVSILNTSQIHIKKLVHSKITDDDDLMAKVLKTNKLKGTLTLNQRERGGVSFGDDFWIMEFLQ